MVSKDNSDKENKFHKIPGVDPDDLNSVAAKTARMAMASFSSVVIESAQSPEDLIKTLIGILDALIPAVSKKTKTLGLFPRPDQSERDQNKLTTKLIFGLMCSLSYDDVEDIMICMKMVMDKMGYHYIPAVLDGSNPLQGGSSDNPASKLAETLRELKRKLRGGKNRDDLFDD